MNPYIIERASTHDVSQIHALIESRVVSSQQKTQIKTGLIDYRVPSPEKYALRVESPFFLVAKNKTTADIVGMIDGYDSRTISRYFPGDIFLDDINNTMATAGPFVYLNTVAVARSEEDKGLGKILFESVESLVDSQFQFLLGAIVHKPVINRKSVDLVSRQGFALVHERDAYGLTFGIYTKAILK